VKPIRLDVPCSLALVTPSSNTPALRNRSMIRSAGIGNALRQKMLLVMVTDMAAITA
jgi:hypothetical protein